MSTVSVNLDNIAGAEDSDHHLVKPGQLNGRGGNEIVSTVSLNRDDCIGADDTRY